MAPDGSGAAISLRDAEQAIAEHGTKQAAAAALGVSRHVLYRILAGKNSLAAPANPDASVKMRRLEMENERLRRELRGVLDREAASDELNDLIQKVRRAEPKTAPDWMLRARSRGSGHPSIASAVISDLHDGEQVRPAEINGYNLFDLETSARRTRAVFENIVTLCRDFSPGLDLQGLIVALGGDMVSGFIHEELERTNLCAAPESILRCRRFFREGLLFLKAELGTPVHVPAVRGNHSRLRKKPQAKRSARESFDWLIYQLVAEDLAEEEGITFDIGEGQDVYFSAFDTRFVLTHGDQFRGGSGIAGIATPLALGNHRKNKKSSAMGLPYDWMIFCHFHQLLLGWNGMIGNGSIKGYDEYADDRNFAPEPPRQAFFIVDPDHGVTLRAPILCE